MVISALTLNEVSRPFRLQLPMVKVGPNGKLRKRSKHLVKLGRSFRHYSRWMFKKNMFCVDMDNYKPNPPAKPPGVLGGLYNNV